MLIVKIHASLPSSKGNEPWLNDGEKRSSNIMNDFLSVSYLFVIIFLQRNERTDYKYIVHSHCCQMWDKLLSEVQRKEPFFNYWLLFTGGYWSLVTWSTKGKKSVRICFMQFITVFIFKLEHDWAEYEKLQCIIRFSFVSGCLK